MRKIRKIIIILLVAAALAGLGIFTYKGNTTVVTEYFEIKSDRIPRVFDGYRIAHISDLHDACFGENNSVIFDILKKERPDVIFMTGDMIDSRRTNIENTIDFITQAMQIAPCYYVTGNHEAALFAKKPDVKKQIKATGVELLENELTYLTRDNYVIRLIGINDPLFDFRLNDYGVSGAADRWLEKFDSDDGYFRILLSHRPDMFEVYVKHGVNLALCGHVHGGQIRLPLIGGVIGPGQGLFPKYDAGLYTKGETNMIISRGIGNSGFPVRFNNNPEVVIIDLYSE